MSAENELEAQSPQVAAPPLKRLTIKFHKLNVVRPKEFPPGTELEGEIMNDDFPYYEDCIHKVKVVRFLPDKNMYECKSLAFDDEPPFEWRPELLHEPRDADEPKDLDNVHVRIRKRCIKGEFVDGHLDEDGIWVKGSVVRSEHDKYHVQHVSWAGKKSKTTVVDKSDIRSGW